MFYYSFLGTELNQVEQLKFLMALSNDLVPSVKHILYKNLLSGDTPVQRVCVEGFLAKLCSFDKEQKALMKEINVGDQKSFNETTPGIVRSKVIVPDPSLVGLEIKKYLNKNNKGCPGILVYTIPLGDTNNDIANSTYVLKYQLCYGDSNWLCVAVRD